jgi:hypothetical protein
MEPTPQQENKYDATKESEGRLTDFIAYDWKEELNPSHCWNIRNLCEEDNCECGEIVRSVKCAEGLYENAGKRIIGEILDNPGLGEAVIATRSYLKGYIRELQN